MQEAINNALGKNHFFDLRGKLHIIDETPIIEVDHGTTLFSRFMSAYCPDYPEAIPTEIEVITEVAYPISRPARMSFHLGDSKHPFKFYFYVMTFDLFESFFAIDKKCQGDHKHEITFCVVPESEEKNYGNL